MSELDYSNIENSEITAREVFDILRRRRWTLLVTFALFLIIAALLTARTTRVYRAQATMLVEKSPLRVGRLDSGGPIVDPLNATQPHSVETQVELLLSGPLKKRVIHKIGPVSDEAYPHLDATQLRDTDVIEVTAESTSPRVARDAANTLVKEFIDQTDQNDLASIRKTRQFAEQRLSDAESRLADADRRLREFKEKYRLPDLVKNRENAITRANNIREELRLVENQWSSLLGQIQQLRAEIAAEPRWVKTDERIIPNPEVERLRSELEKLELERISLVRLYKVTQPEVQEVDRKIRHLQRALARQPRTVSNGVTRLSNPQRVELEAKLHDHLTQARGLAPQVDLLRQQCAQAQGLLTSFPRWEAQLSKLERDKAEAQDAQHALSSQLWDLRLKEQAQAVAARPMTPASMPRTPVRPSPAINLLVAAALGLVFGIGAACLRDMTDDRVHTADDAERTAGLPVLGRVPSFPKGAPRLIALAGESPVKESYRRLRAGISFASSAAPVQSLMVTSAMAGEGKSTTACNLAIAAAQQGRRVILVDADLRGPSLAPLFGVRSEPGLSDLLVGEGSLTDALVATKVRDVLLLPAGSPMENVSELLASTRMGEVMQELTGRADLVILDTPPCLPVADSEVLGAWVDAGVLVVGLGRAERRAVSMARELLDQAHVRLLGTVLNRMKASDRGYYYRYRTPDGASSARLPAAPRVALPQAPVTGPPAREENTA
jgi:succinoglycan biosynthesis transport protein ExoP